MSIHHALHLGKTVEWRGSEPLGRCTQQADTGRDRSRQDVSAAIHDCFGASHAAEHRSAPEPEFPTKSYIGALSTDEQPRTRGHVEGRMSVDRPSIS